MQGSILIVSIVVFIAFKWEYLGLPYYWDEAWVYAPAVMEMVESGPKLSPDAISPELSRGHPVLFHFVSAVWLKLTGAGRFQAHLFALSISVALFLAVYSLVSISANKNSALATTIATMLSEPILAQSGLLLPEVMLTLFILLSLLGYLLRYILLYIFFGSAALLTKESAIVFVLSIILWQTYMLLIDQKPITQVARQWLGVSIVPLIVSALYFVWQYNIQGWFLYPEHIGLISIEPRDITYKAKLLFIDTFERQGMLVPVYSVCFIAILYYDRVKLGWRILAVIIFISAIKILFGRWELPSSLIPIASLALLISIFPILIPTIFHHDERKGELIGISYIFLIGYWVFSSLNFYAPRYTISIIPIALILLIVFAHEVFADRSRWMFSLLTGGTCLVLLAHIGQTTHIGDTRLNYKDAIAVHVNLVRYAEKNELFEVPIQASFMQAYYMNDPDAGYLSSERTFSNVHDSLTHETSFVITSNSTPSKFDTLATMAHFTPIWRTRVGIVSGLVYRREGSK